MNSSTLNGFFIGVATVVAGNWIGRKYFGL